MKAQSVNKHLADLIDAKEAYQAQIKKIGKSSVTAIIQDFLAAHTSVKAVGWAQYTPYFNDGEPCTFRVNECRVLLDGANEDGDEDEDSDGDSFDSSFKDTYELDDKGLVKALDKLTADLSEVEDVLEDAFGDHVAVIADKSGIRTEEYSHD